MVTTPTTCPADLLHACPAAPAAEDPRAEIMRLVTEAVGGAITLGLAHTTLEIDIAHGGHYRVTVENLSTSEAQL